LIHWLQCVYAFSVSADTVSASIGDDGTKASSQLQQEVQSEDAECAKGDDILCISMSLLC